MFVPHEMQRAASTLANLRSTTASIIGPALGGLARSCSVGIGLPRQLGDVHTLIDHAYSLRATAASVKLDDGDVAAMRTGLRYARSRPDIMGTYVVDLLAMSWPSRVMLPFVAARFHETYALAVLYCALPAGALIASLTSGWSHRIHRYGRAIVWPQRCGDWDRALWVFIFSLARAPRTGDRRSGRRHNGIFRTTMWNESIPPEIRGRMAGIEMILLLTRTDRRSVPRGVDGGLDDVAFSH